MRTRRIAEIRNNIENVKSSRKSINFHTRIYVIKKSVMVEEEEEEKKIDDCLCATLFI